MKKVIVFGATGNLGAYITIYLKSVGYDVIAVGHRKDDNGFFASRGMKYYSVDITKPEEFEQFLQKIFIVWLILQESYLPVILFMLVI